MENSAFGHKLWGGGLLLVCLAACALCVLPGGYGPLGAASALLLTSLVPGWLVVEAIYAHSAPGESPTLAGRLLLGVGASQAFTVVAGLWLYYAMGRLALLPLVSMYAAVSLAGFLVILRGGPRPGLSSYRPYMAMAWPAAVVLFGAFFRLYRLSYSDFRGDEAEVLLRALSVIWGVGEPVLNHTKGPAETLVTASTALLSGGMDELSARLPFGLASVAAVGVVYALGREVFGRRVGLWAGALCAVHGLFITYSRTAQYQNLVLLMSVGAAWCFYRFYLRGAWRDLLLGGVLASAASFGHYEGVSVFVMGAYLAAVTLTHRKMWTPRRSWPAFAVGALCVVIVASFYVPFFSSPLVAGAREHVSKRLGGTPPYNNLDPFYVNWLFYNSTVFTWWVGAVLWWGLGRGFLLAFADDRRKYLIIALMPITVILSYFANPWFAFLFWGGVLLLFMTSRAVSVEVKGLLYWLSLPFVVYVFGTVRPGNHYYVFMPALVLVAALSFEHMLRACARLRAESLRRAALASVVGVSAIAYAASAYYEYVLFLRTDLEYILTYPGHRLAAYPVDPRFPFDIRIGWGFPYRLGWQTIGELYRDGTLDGDWDSDDEGNSLTWYTYGAPRHGCYPDYYFLADVRYKAEGVEVPTDVIEGEYALCGEVFVNGSRRIRIYRYDPLGEGCDTTAYNEPFAERTAVDFGRLRASALGGGTEWIPNYYAESPPRFGLSEDGKQAIAGHHGDSRIMGVLDEIALVGYDVDGGWAEPGGVVVVTLYWQEEAPVTMNYKVFVHLEEEGGDARLQADDFPACGSRPTIWWKSGEVIIDRHVVRVPRDAPEGPYNLLIGLYESESGTRMDLLDAAGAPSGNYFQPGRVRIGR